MAQNPFGQQQQLANKKVVAIETFSFQDITYSPISTTNQVVSQAVFKICYLSLYRASVPEFRAKNGLVFPASDEGLYYDKIPLSRLRMVGNADTTAGSVTSNNQSSMFRIKPAEMSWTKSYIFCANSVAMAGPQSVVFMIHYLNQQEDWTPYM
jgi:hypothetical protein